MQAVREARKEDFVDIPLVGHEERIWRLAMTAGLNLKGTDIIDVKDTLKANRQAVVKVAEGRVDILMKGMVNSSDFIKAVLDPEGGMRTKKLLSHLAVNEIPGYYRLIYMTDGGLNVNPDGRQKKGYPSKRPGFFSYHRHEGAPGGSFDSQ